jgi:hypothetical protein
MSPSSRIVSTRVKAEVVIAGGEREPLELNYIDESEGRSHRHHSRRSPSSRTVSTRAKVQVVATEVEGESLELNCIDEGDGRSSSR